MIELSELDSLSHAHVGANQCFHQSNDGSLPGTIQDVPGGIASAVWACHGR